jgi:hypothetical protein
MNHLNTKFSERLLEGYELLRYNLKNKQVLGL